MDRILIIGATGYIGKYMAKASVSLGYPTFAFVRPSTAAPYSSKSQMLQQFRDDGIVILEVGYSNVIKVLHFMIKSVMVCLNFNKKIRQYIMIYNHHKV